MAAGQLETADRLAEAYWLLEHVDAPQKTRGLDAASLEHSLRSSVQPLSSKVLAVLARLASLQADNSQTEQETRGHIDRAAQDALRALRDPTIDTESRVSVLEVLGKTQSETGDYAASAQTYEQLVTHRRSAIDFYNLGISLAKSQQVGRAEQAFRESIRIDPSYALPYRSLSVLYRAVDPDASERMMNMAKSLIQNEQ
jgi:Flp pilus assembly protein TadD